METPLDNETMEINHGQNLKLFRVTKGMKQEKLADILGVTQQNVSHYEKQKTLDDATLEKCAKALDIPFDLLKNMPSNREAPIQIFKDVTFNNSTTANSLPNTPERDGIVTNHYPGEQATITALNEVIRLLKAENKSLRAENNHLKELLKPE